MNCDFCLSSNTVEVYEVPNSERGIKIIVCSDCGLVQSLQTKEKCKKRIVTTSSDANWGNVRHGKGIRLPKAIEVIAPVLAKEKIQKVLDIGSNRGDFVLWIHKNYPKIQIDAIEPDRNVIDTYKDQKNLKLQIARFENIDISKESFDLIYCSHTLEHANSAKQMLEGSYEALKKGGYLFLEIPNIDIIGESDIVEEFFIDKHTFHFNRSLLVDLVEQLGFSVISGANDKDVSNVTLLLKKENGSNLFKPKDKKLSKKNIALIDGYKERLSQNRKKLKEVGDKMNAFMERQKVALWGGGRIFDALVKYGGLNTKNIYCLVDDYLSKYIPEIHGVKLHNSHYLRMATPDVVFVLAKNSTEEIYQLARKFGVRHVFRFNELLN